MLHEKCISCIEIKVAVSKHNYPNFGKIQTCKLLAYFHQLLVKLLNILIWLNKMMQYMYIHNIYMYRCSPRKIFKIHRQTSPAGQLNSA